MKNDWWFKMEHVRWLTDEQLNRCSLETQGFWIRAICVMHKSVTARLVGTEAELGRLLSVTPSEFRRCVAELDRTKTATVTQTSKMFTLVSRKFARELKKREQDRLRQRRKRGHADVPDESQDRVRDEELEIEKDSSSSEEEKSSTTTTADDAEWLRGLAKETPYRRLDVPNEYDKARVWAATNNRQCTRRFFVNWLNRAKPMEVKNGHSKKSNSSSGESSREIAERIGADAEF